VYEIVVVPFVNFGVYLWLFIVILASTYSNGLFNISVISIFMSVGVNIVKFPVIVTMLLLILLLSCTDVVDCILFTDASPNSLLAYNALFVTFVLFELMILTV